MGASLSSIGGGSNYAEKDPLEDELGKYENKWVAILQSERRIVGSRDRAVEAKREAES
jgi:hypothetical protein